MNKIFGSPFLHSQWIVVAELKLPKYFRNSPFQASYSWKEVEKRMEEGGRREEDGMLRKEGRCEGGGGAHMRWTHIFT